MAVAGAVACRGGRGGRGRGRGQREQREREGEEGANIAKGKLAQSTTVAPWGFQPCTCTCFNKSACTCMSFPLRHLLHFTPAHHILVMQPLGLPTPTPALLHSPASNHNCTSDTSHTPHTFTSPLAHAAMHLAHATMHLAPDPNPCPLSQPGKHVIKNMYLDALGEPEGSSRRTSLGGLQVRGVDKLRCAT